jgi:5-methylcytosine-specific restriction endonuclease McrA
VSCKEAGDNSKHQKRPAPYPGPRCYRCHHARRRVLRRRRRVSGVFRSFGWAEAEYLALRESQRAADGRVRCLGCERVVDAGKEPAMDHSHELERRGVPIRFTVRMLLCSTCNQYVGYIGDRPERLIRLALGLIEMPAQKVLRKLDEG